MGKYMKKTKMAGEVAVMDVVSQSPLGVRTRARTLALQKLAVAAPPPPAAAAAGGGGSYLQLRSRRLLKHVAAAEAKKPSREAGKKAEKEGDGCGGEASSGENALGRITRESTPSNLIRDSETLGTPGSTNRPTSSCPINVRTRTAARRSIPTTHEMEEFFAGAERQQQRIFTEKYNYDPVKDMPLPGRYEWVRLK